MQEISDLQFSNYHTKLALQGLDCVVNNAGIMLNGDILSTTEEQFDRSMNVNVRSAFTVTKAAIPHLEKSEARLSTVFVKLIYINTLLPTKFKISID